MGTTRTETTSLREAMTLLTDLSRAGHAVILETQYLGPYTSTYGTGNRTLHRTQADAITELNKIVDGTGEFTEFVFRRLTVGLPFDLLKGTCYAWSGA
jgi:hypothetical protein